VHAVYPHASSKTATAAYSHLGDRSPRCQSRSWTDVQARARGPLEVRELSVIWVGTTRVACGPKGAQIRGQLLAAGGSACRPARPHRSPAHASTVKAIPRTKRTPAEVRTVPFSSIPIPCSTRYRHSRNLS
jgi:hypothetical protein